MSATTAESPANIALAQAVSRTLAMSVAIYLSLVYSVGYAILAWSVNNRLAPISYRADYCGIEAALLIGLLVLLVILPTALLWLGKIGQGLLAYGIGQFVALAAGLVFHGLLLARACLI